MTIATVQENITNARLGPDKNILPNLSGNILVIGGDTESPPFTVKGFRSLGFIDPGDLTGVTAFQIHVSNLLLGTYANLDISDFTAGTLQAFSTELVKGWAFAKIVLVGTLTGSGNIPIGLS